MRERNTYTEDEARAKWCPLARLSEMGGTQNRAGPEAGFYCIAGNCMAWRKTGQIGINPEGKIVDRDMDGRTRWENVGFCGAFGTPNT